MEANKSTRALGLMCGTSRDGLDLIDASFIFNGHKWSYEVHGSQFFELNTYIQRLLSEVEEAFPIKAIELHRDAGMFFVQCVKSYLKEVKGTPDIISSHGITIFHQPERKITWQTGSGAVMAAELSIPVICDFRSGDVALGGQGAPLVPKGDLELFGSYEACLNLGGFSNMTILGGEEVLAFDISPCNIVLNEFANILGKPYDKGGEIARTGKLLEGLFNELEKLDYYQIPAPKSLGKEWVLSNIQPILTTYSNETANDLLHTFTMHIGSQISKSANKLANCLVTGGGAYNDFLLETLTKLSATKWIVPEDELINSKEALIFAFLGVLRWHNLPNTLPSATGASRAISAGAVYLP